INNAHLLVFANYHNGKTACFMSDCSPHSGTHQSMSWPFYAALWVKIRKRQRSFVLTLIYW
ncbi:glutamine amidotransferase, partial [Escherichia coli]|nr:glutamine amidotransferase [Escherichia coli]